MTDRPSYTIHSQPSSVTGSGCMDIANERLDWQVPFDQTRIFPQY